jgi:hypothetical protein
LAWSSELCLRVLSGCIDFNEPKMIVNTKFGWLNNDKGL